MNNEPTCDRCHKPISELKEFEEGIYKGRKLGKIYRAMYEGPNIDEYEKILDEYISEAQPGEVWEDNINELEAKYGHEKVDEAFFYDQLGSTVGSSIECKDCIGK